MEGQPPLSDQHKPSTNPIPLQMVVDDFAWAFKEVDSEKPQPKSQYRPGIGPLEERVAISKAVEKLRRHKPVFYKSLSPVQYPNSRKQCDLFVRGHLAVEFKLVRPFGDNGKEDENWIGNLLYPFPAEYISSGSAISDCIKLARSGFPVRKAVIVFGYEHSPPKIRLEPVMKLFELLAEQVGVIHGPMVKAEFTDLVHPVHQVGRVFAWEVIGWNPSVVKLVFPEIA